MLELPDLSPTNFNIVISTAGGFLLIFGLVSHGVKQRLLLSEALVAVLVGVFLSHVVSILQPSNYACGSVEVVKTITLEFSRLVLGIQLLLAGMQMPSKYLKTARWSLFWLLCPGLTLSWLSAGVVIWFVLPKLGWVGALSIAACIAPTDPVLSNAIIKGGFAERHTPRWVRELIAAEAGMNDGLGYPFLFFCLLYLKFVTYDHRPGEMALTWFIETWGYVIIFSVVYGALAGILARKLHFWSAKRGLIEEESSIIYAVALSLFVLGTCGILKTDDVLACFIAGCAYGWDHRAQPNEITDMFCSSVDMLLNASIFIWYGAVAPWNDFLYNDLVPFPKLILLGTLILIFRRLPIVLLLRSKIPELETRGQAAFVGFFGPIGVSAIYYVMLSREFLLDMSKHAHGEKRTYVLFLEQSMWIIVWSLVMDSVLVHGIALPIGKAFRRTFPGVYAKYFRLRKKNDLASSSEDSEWTYADEEFDADIDDDSGTECGDEQQQLDFHGPLYGTLAAKDVI